MLIGQEPRIAPHRGAMRTSRRCARRSRRRVDVQATTTDFLGFTGRGEGLAAQAVALLDGCRHEAVPPPSEAGTEDPGLPLSLPLSLVVGCGSGTPPTGAFPSLPLERVAGGSRFPVRATASTTWATPRHQPALHRAHERRPHRRLRRSQPGRCVSFSPPHSTASSQFRRSGACSRRRRTFVRRHSRGEHRGDNRARPRGDYPDGIAWDPVECCAFVSHESGGVETVVSPAAASPQARIPIGGDAPNARHVLERTGALADVQSRTTSR